MPDPFRLDGRTALITGGASGIGESTARVLAEAGAKVLIADLNVAAAQRLAAELPGAVAISCDITNAVSVDKMFGGISHLDILINNAGIGHVGTIEETSLDDLERLFRVNVTGLFLVTRAAIPLLIAAGGNIVNIASVAALAGVRRRFGFSATKGAVIAITRQLAVDYPTQFRVNCICPGTVDTPFLEGYLERYHREDKDKVRAELNARQPMGRVGKPEEIAYLALYLCSANAGFVNGSIITIDGGWTAS